MKKFLFLAVILFGFLSCSKDETSLNKEADILDASLDKIELQRDTKVSNNNIVFTVASSVDLTQLAPKFSISSGATISPASGTVRDFTTPQKYTVTSESQEWKKTYRVEVNVIGAGSSTLKYDFEHVENPFSSYKFQSFVEVQGTDTSRIWTSGNVGLAFILGEDAAYDAFPTYQSKVGKTGKCATLVTGTTGPMGAAFKSPIASGNLFLGSFEIDMTNTLKSTHFGIPFLKKPVNVKGFYKYKSGAEYKEYTNAAGEFSTDGVVINKKDSFTIYAVMYEVSEVKGTNPDVHYLDGTNVKTDESIVGIADMGNGAEASNWTSFEIPFLWKKQLDPKKLAAGKYNITLLFASSSHGDKFNGALGSTLSVDDVEITIE